MPSANAFEPLTRDIDIARIDDFFPDRLGALTGVNRALRAAPSAILAPAFGVGAQPIETVGNVAVAAAMPTFIIVRVKMTINFLKKEVK